MRRGPKPAKSKEAKPPAARKSLKDDGVRVRDLEKQLAKALRDKAETQEQFQTRDRELVEAQEQQAATAEILRVIGASPTDVQPVFDAIAESAARLCDAAFVGVFRFDGEWISIAALNGLRPDEREAALRYFPRRPTPGGPGLAHVVLTGQVAHIPDVQSDPAWRASASGPAFSTVQGFRAFLAVPLIREGVCLGAVNVWRREASPFSEQHIELLKTFADQAAIAIENVRLFNETTEALERQTATGEILRVISSSPTDAQPVFETIAASALNLCDARLCTVFRFDGNLIHLVALHQVSAEGAAVYRDAYPAPPGRGGGTHRAILTGSIVHIPDIREDPEYELQALARANDFGCVLSVPMLRDGHPIGAITVGREAARPFPDEQIQLLKTFADQAVIAIENVRLFKELESSNGELRVALEQQTATSDILRVISGAQRDVQPVFDTIVQSAARLCNAAIAAVFRTDGGTLFHPANYGDSPEALAAARARYPRPLDMETIPGIAILTRSVAHFPDVDESAMPQHVRQVGRLLGFRGVVGVPMLREGEAVGAIVVARREPGWFSDAEVALLEHSLIKR